MPSKAPKSNKKLKIEKASLRTLTVEQTRVVQGGTSSGTTQQQGRTVTVITTSSLCA